MDTRHSIHNPACACNLVLSCQGQLAANLTAKIKGMRGNRTESKYVASRLNVSHLCYISVHARYALKQQIGSSCYEPRWSIFLCLADVNLYCFTSCCSSGCMQSDMSWSVTGLIRHRKIHTCIIHGWSHAQHNK